MSFDLHKEKGWSAIRFYFASRHEAPPSVQHCNAPSCPEQCPLSASPPGSCTPSVLSGCQRRRHRNGSQSYRCLHKEKTSKLSDCGFLCSIKGPGSPQGEAHRHSYSTPGRNTSNQITHKKLALGSLMCARHNVNSAHDGETGTDKFAQLFKELKEISFTLPCPGVKQLAAEYTVQCMNNQP